MDSLFYGPWVTHNKDKFRPIFDEIMYRNDVYYILKDFDSYVKAQEKISKLYKDQLNWQKMALINIASSGFFTSDRTIEQYVQDIWHLEKLGK
jgi:starch phosphorylase